MSSLPEAERYTFFLNPYGDQRFAHCPRCGSQTHMRTRVLVVQVRPDLIVPAKMSCRYCTQCDLLIADRDQVGAQVGHVLPPGQPQVIADDLVVLGTLDRSQLPRKRVEEVALEDAIRAFRPFRELVHFELVEAEEGTRTVEVPVSYPVVADVPVPEPAELQRLPQSDETWQIGVKRMHAWIAGDEEGGELYRPYGMLVVSLPGRSDETMAGPLVVFQQVMPAEPSPVEIRDTLWKAMIAPTPSAGEPRRPSVVQVADAILATALESELVPLDIACEAGPTPVCDEVFGELERFLSGGEEEIAGLLDMPGVTPEQVGSLFEAAADFYRQAPWEWLYNEDLIAIRYPVPDGEWRYVSVMGNAGMEFGLAVFDSLADFDLLESGAMPEFAVGHMDYHSLTFDDMTAVPFADLDALERYGWEIAADDAYPIPLTFTRDEEVLRPGSEELAWYEVALRAVSAFVDEFWPEEEGWVPEPVAVNLRVPLMGRDVEVELRYPADIITEEELETAAQQVYCFRVQLKRRRGRKHRIEILGSQTLADFDATIRDVFDHDVMDHLSGFWIPGGRGQPDIDLGTIEPFGGGDRADALIAFLDLNVGDRLKYVYDFGDWIEHTIMLEAISQREEGIEYPRVVRVS